jgi:cytochrome c oxidase subunit 2
VPYGEAYTQPRIVKLDDSTYQVYMTAQMWSFEPTEIYLPVGAEVDLYLTTKDVVHGLAILNKNVNMMAVYGGINKTTVRFDEPGVYPIVCHEYCGSGHQNMMSEIIVNYPNQ